MTLNGESKPQRSSAPGRFDSSTPQRYAIGITWSIPRDRRRFYKGTANRLMACLTDLHAAKKLAAVMPLRHRPLSAHGEGGSSWTGYWVLVLAEGVDPDEIWSVTERALATMSSSESQLLVRAEVLRPQPGFDLYYPHYPRKRGLRREPRWHWIEYAVSRPEARDEYYRDQYLFSAAVIRRFYDSGVVRRIMGFESIRHLRNEGARPVWDVVHITGFNVARLPQIGWILWRMKPDFDAMAQKVGHKTAFDVVHSWCVFRPMLNTDSD